MAEGNGSRPEEVPDLPYDDAVALLPPGDRIHTFLQFHGMLLGADEDRAEILLLLRQSPHVAVSGPMAQSLGHGIAVMDTAGETLFIETRRS